MIQETYKAIIDSYRPKLVPLEDNLTAAVFPFMKIFPAEFCLRKAREEGRIRSQTLIVETSSGNLALGLALVCNLSGYRLTIVSDYACDGFLRRRLEDLGARVEIVSAPSVNGGYQRARLNRLEEIRETSPEHFWVNQYDNPGNPGAFSFLAAQLVEALGQIDCLVGTVGSGGSVCGTSGFLRELFPEMTTVGVDTFGSVLFGQPDQIRTLRGLGNSVLPKNLDHRLFDEVHWVTAAEAYKATRMLHQQSTLFCGGTSGAAWLVARHWAKKNPKAKVVCILPDDGYRYTDTIYSDEYLWKENLWLPELPECPREVDHPLKAGPVWSRMQWGRREYSDVIKSTVSAAV
ncbi:MAG TPA: cysteine synthase family protein [Candidatus Solibacter sp.]|nr:cysteine synthase family protein [Candidatus Solibacter sp.]